MAKRDINDSGLARKIDTSHVAIGHWRRGERVPNYGNCIKLSRFFDIPEEDVLTITGHRQPSIAGHLSATGNISEPKPTYEITNPQDDDPTLLEIYHALKRLPPHQRRQVLEFVLFQLHRTDEPAPTASTIDTAAVATAAT